MFWGPVHICKEVSNSPTRTKNTTEHDLQRLLLGDSYFPRGKPSRRGRPYFQRQQCRRIFCPTHDLLLWCRQVWYVFADFDISSSTFDSFFFPLYLVALEGFTESLRKELSPEWNIQATIIQPGGFNTDWRNMPTLPLHPAYDTESSPAKQHRTMLMGTGTNSGIPFIGSPEKAAKAFITLAQMRQDLPLRVQFGTDSLAYVRHTAMKTISDGEKLESVSHSTNVDGIDPKEYTKNLLAVLG